MKTDIYLDGSLYAAREWDGVPRVGELIQLKLDLFVVDMVVWCDPDHAKQANLFVKKHKQKA